MSRMWHGLVCPVRQRWLRWRTGMPFWSQDKTAVMLGVARLGCHRCGRGSIAHHARADRVADGGEEG